MAPKPTTVKDKQALERYRKLVQRISEQTAIDVFETEAEKTARIARLKGDYDAFVKYYFEKTYAMCDNAPFHIKLARKVKRD